MNVLSALRITPKFLHRFSMYTCEMQEEPDYETLSSSGSSSHDALDKVDEGAYYYRPLSRRGSLRVPTTNANASAHRKLEPDSTNGNEDSDQGLTSTRPRTIVELLSLQQPGLDPPNLIPYERPRLELEVINWCGVCFIDCAV
uniref:Uncharacterized protein n=1 Tax=Anopheles maculatus TaxID=74869 RepID=A0A182T742_9DIPT